MTKYSFEFKYKVVQEYLSGEGGYQFLSNKYGISHLELVHQWVNRYNEFGVAGLQRNRQRTAYDSNFKLNAVNLYLTSKKSYREVANQLELNNPALITRWVIEYRQKGEFAFISKPRGRPRKEGKVTQSKPRNSKKELSELEQQLAEAQKENLYLQVENEYFKRAEEAAKGTGNAGKSRLVQSLQGQFKFPLQLLLRASGLARSTYFYWLKRFERPNKDEAIEQAMLAIRKEHKNAGYRPMVQLLKTKGFYVNHKKVQRLMKKLGLRVTSFWRKSRKYNSYKGTVGKIAKNKLQRRFNTRIPHQKITTDTTEFKYYEKGTQKKAYLNPFLDLFNNEIVSFELSKQPTYQPISTALHQALEATSDCLYRRTFHSDQGWAYQMANYVYTLRRHRVFQSMSRKGNCHDNSVMENFFGLLKQEIYYGRVFNSYQELSQAITEWIGYYNTKRIKKKLNWMSPTQFRLTYQN
ncbi:IS3 family transposase [Lactococcus lactis]|uniref:IS3 family transposase n=1 Tax=Lactococcus lactis TaxID=1358 RepID=UPI003BF888CD